MALVLAGILLAILGLHPFTTYPVSLAVLRRLRPQPRPAARTVATGRSVALCVCAYNEASIIATKLQNMVALRGRVPQLELLLYVDCASDGTADIARGFDGDVRLVVAESRHGKTHGMNTLVGMTQADIVVFTDANVMFDPNAVEHLLLAFEDPRVGCVCGHLVYDNADGGAVAATGSLYWRIEERIKELESATGNAMGADGSIFAIRRALHRPPPPDLIDDMYVSLSVLCEGWRVVRCPDAIAHEASSSRPAEEFQRKVRIACQAFNVHRALSPRLRRLGWLDSYKYVSHKLLRWLTIFLVGAGGLLVALGLVALGAWPLLALLVAVSVAAPASAWVVGPSGFAAKLVGVVAAFVATGLGVVRSLRGDRFQVWTPPASTRSAVGR